MKYKCARCQKELEYKTYGGYAIDKMKSLCPKCWKEYIEIKNRHCRELIQWWDNE